MRQEFSLMRLSRYRPRQASNLTLGWKFRRMEYQHQVQRIAVTSFHGHFVPSHFVPFYGHFVPNNSHFVPQIVTSFHEIVTSFQSPNPVRFAEEDSRTFSLRNVTGRTEPVDRRTGFNGASVRGLRYARPSWRGRTCCLQTMHFEDIVKNFWTLGVADGWWLIKLIWVAQNKVVLLYTGPGSKIKLRRKRAIWFGEQLMKGTISTLLFVCLFVCLKENVSPLIVFAVMFYLLCNLQLFVCGTKWLYRGTKWLSCGTKWLFFGTKWLGTKWLWNEVTGYRCNTYKPHYP